tara:strand:+ start:1493 stop:2416 length:924 start_codon:yes stop_codon:yes gene_type:complete
VIAKAEMEASEIGLIETALEGWRVRTTEGANKKNEYVQLCEAACKENKVFQFFKQDRRYQEILEHVELEVSMAALERIGNLNPQIIQNYKKYLINDFLGAPTTYNVKWKSGSPLAPEEELELSNISLSTIRYMKVLSDLVALFGDLENFNIVEIGGGYGGLATVICQEFRINKYYNIDLKWPAKLAKKYTRILGFENFISLEPPQIDSFSSRLNGDAIDLVISNYAFSECNEKTQDEYIEKIIARAHRGYITQNGSNPRAKRVFGEIKKTKEDLFIFDYDVTNRRHPIFTFGADDYVGTRENKLHED